MSKNKAFFWFAFSAIYFVLSVVVYIQDVQKAKIAIETALFDGFLTIVIVAIFWALWARFNKRIFIPGATWFKVILGFILPTSIIAGVLIIRGAISREDRFFPMADFTFSLMIVGLWLTQAIVYVFWQNNSKENRN